MVRPARFEPGPASEPLPVHAGIAARLARAGIRLGGILRTRAGHAVARAQHPFHWVGLTLGGCGRWRCRDRGTVRSGWARRGGLLVFPRRTPYWLETPQSWDLLWFSLVESHRPQLEQRAGMADAQVAASLAAAMSGVLREARARDAQGEQAALLHAGLVALELDRLLGAGQAGAAHLVAELAGLITAQPAAAWDIDTISRGLGLSPRQTHRMVQRHYLCTPHQLVVRLRLRAAQALLEDRDLSLLAISRSVGYGSASALSHAFARATGHSPERWRSRSSG